MEIIKIKKYRKISALVLFLTFLTVACSTTIKTNNIQKLQGGSPLKSLAPVKIAIGEFKDERHTRYKDRFLGEYPLCRARETPFTVVIDQEVTEVVRRQIGNELIRNGHEVMHQEGSDRSELTITGIITEYWCNYIDLSVRYHEFRADVSARIIITRTSDSREMMSKQFSGFWYTEGNRIGSRAAIDVTNLALLNMIKDLTTDSDFLDIMRNIQ